MPAEKKSLLKLILIPLILAAAIVIGVAVFMLHPGNITEFEARNIALEHVGGGVANWPERDFERFQRVWVVEVFAERFTHDVYINRFTGEIVRAEVEDRRNRD